MKISEISIKPAYAFIREDECIGCLKCLYACPFDAILGERKKAHTVITEECTGCELCIPPCPVDCIDLVAVKCQEKATLEKRLNRAIERFKNHQAKKACFDNNESIASRKKIIQSAVKRAKEKRKKQGLLRGPKSTK